MEDQKKLDTKIEDLANFLCDRLLGNEPVDVELIQGFKALGNYYTATRKLGKVSDEDSTTKSSGFGAIRARIQAAGKTDDANKAQGDSDGGDGEPIPFPARQ